MKVETFILPGVERIVRLVDKSLDSSLLACLHDTTLGPAVGCVSLRHTADMRSVLDQACALGRAMTWKAAAADLPVGGGHMAIVCGSAPADRAKLLELAVHAVELLGGCLYAAEGPGVEPEDLVYLKQYTPWVVGLPEDKGGCGDPSQHTAQGVLEAIKAALGFVFESEDPSGRSFVVQGLGRVGRRIVELLCEGGARVYAADIDGGKVQLVSSRLPVEVVPPEDVYQVESDVFVPCAVPHVLNERTIPLLRCKIVAGAANEQLASRLDAQRLAERGIVYVPDFVANGGGLISLACEISGGPCTLEAISEKIRQIGERVRMLLETVRREGITPYEAARRFVRERIGTVKRALSRLNG